MIKKWIGLLAIVVISSVALAEAPAEATKEALAMNGTVGAVSNYIFRGAALGGVALQGSMNLHSDYVPGLAAGAWLSSFDTNDRAKGAGNETDYYVSYTYEKENMSAGIGWTGYSFDFNRFANEIGVENEYFINGRYRFVSLAYYMVPAQKSTEGTNGEKGDDQGGPFSWTELTFSSEMKKCTAKLKFEGGNYNIRGNNTDESEMTSDAVLTVGKTVTDNISVNFNFLKMINDADVKDYTDQFWFGADIAY